MTMSFGELIRVGGITMYVLLICSIVSFAIILERIIYFYRKSWQSRAGFIAHLKGILSRGKVKEALEVCKNGETAIEAVAAAGLGHFGRSETEISRAMEREIAIQTTKLERYINIIGTVGSTAVYVGLFGTVLGIMRAFHDIATTGAGGINTVINGISEALVCTAAGLFVAVPAVIAYNLFVKRIDTIVTDMELCASEVLEALGEVLGDKHQ